MESPGFQISVIPAIHTTHAIYTAQSLLNSSSWADAVVNLIADVLVFCFQRYRFSTLYMDEERRQGDVLRTLAYKSYTKDTVFKVRPPTPAMDVRHLRGYECLVSPTTEKRVLSIARPLSSIV